MGYRLGTRSLKRLHGVHPDLVAVVKRAIEITDMDFTVLEGLRTRQRQKRLVAKGASKTMRSRHIRAKNGYGHAVDLAPLPNGQISWDWKHFYPIEKAMKQAAKELGVSLQWGGDWRTFKDGPHWQLTWQRYPGK